MLLSCSAMRAVQPFYDFGTFNKPVQELMAEVTKTLLNHDFELIGMFHPANDDSLCVIVFTCDELTSMATGVADRGAFGAALKVGLINNGDQTSVTMLNPNYFAHAYFNEKANDDEVKFMTAKIDSLALNAMSCFSLSPMTYGYDLSIQELREFRYMPTMAGFEDVIEVCTYDEFLEAVTTIKFKLLNETPDCELIYELSFEDKEIAVFGVSFKGDLLFEDKLLGLVGNHCLSSLPFEILVQGNVAYILNPKFRIPLYKPDISWLKLMKIIKLSSEITDAMKEIIETPKGS